MRLSCGLFVCAMILLSRPASYPTSPQPASTEKSQQELLALENHWLQVENDPDALEAILAPDFLHVVPAGIITKDEQLNFMRQHPAPKQSQERHFEDLHIRIYGNVGIVNGVVVESGKRAESKTLFTDVFACRSGKWQAINAQESPGAEREEPR